MTTISDLRQAVEDEIGLDVFSVVEEDRRLLISEIAVSKIVIAILLDFFKGFGGFEELGKKIRERLDRFEQRVWNREDLEQAEDVTELEAFLEQSLRTLRKNRPLAEAISHGQKEVERLLINLGMSEKIANQHAISVSQVILASLTDSAAEKDRGSN